MSESEQACQVTSDEPVITLAHGAGGQAMMQLINDVFLAAFGHESLQFKEDQARFALAELSNHGAQLAFTTDSYVISPVQFPGGDIGKLAVCGTVNDLAVGGAIPKYLSVGFILEEGLKITELEGIVQSMAKTAMAAGVKIVTGDTKVVPRGQADKIYINTSGVGVIPFGVDLKISQVQPSDKILVNGYIGDHGAAVMLARDNMGFNAALQSDCAPLHDLIQKVLAVSPDIRCIRDATRGGIGAVLSDMAQASGVTIAIDENQLPIRAATQSLCELLGLEYLFLANEGLAVFCVPEVQVEAALTAMRSHEFGQHAAIIGEATEWSKSLLYINTCYGSKRKIEVPYGIQLPRIC